jgi:hypothetical protein
LTRIARVSLFIVDIYLSQWDTLIAVTMVIVTELYIRSFSSTLPYRIPAQPISSILDSLHHPEASQIPISGDAAATQPFNTHEFIPTLNQVRHVSHMLLYKLPAELILCILRIAEYCPGRQFTLRNIRSITQAKTVILRHDLAHDIIAREKAQGNDVEWPDIRLDVMTLTIESKDQGWSSDRVQWHGTYEHSRTWLELAVFDDIEPVSTRPVSTSELYRNRHAHDQFETYGITFGPSIRPQLTVSDGAVTEERHEQLTEFWRAVQAAQKPRIEILGCAEFPGWCNHIRLLDFHVTYSERRYID